MQVPVSSCRYKIAAGPQQGQEFVFALLATPRYPLAEDLAISVKQFMIFDYFDKDEDELLNEEEFRQWQVALKKPLKLTWEATVKHYKSQYRLDLDKTNGGKTEVLAAISCRSGKPLLPVGGLRLS